VFRHPPVLHLLYRGKHHPIYRQEWRFGAHDPAFFSKNGSHISEFFKKVKKLGCGKYLSDNNAKNNIQILYILANAKMINK
jgi:hypothetical protein